jgi:hypothetical protein
MGNREKGEKLAGLLVDHIADALRRELGTPQAPR